MDLVTRRVAVCLAFIFFVQLASPSEVYCKIKVIGISVSKWNTEIRQCLTDDPILRKDTLSFAEIQKGQGYPLPMNIAKLLEREIRTEMIERSEAWPDSSSELTTALKTLGLEARGRLAYSSRGPNGLRLVERIEMVDLSGEREAFFWIFLVKWK